LLNAIAPADSIGGRFDSARAEFRCLIHDEQIRASFASRKMRRCKSCFGNKRVVAHQSDSAVIAIFAQHSTPFESSTIISRIA
jgi:hypothetical protein